MGCFDYFRIFQNSRVFLYIDRENSKSLSEFEFRAKDSQAKTDQTTDNNKRKNEKKSKKSGGLAGSGARVWGWISGSLTFVRCPRCLSIAPVGRGVHCRHREQDTKTVRMD